MLADRTTAAAAIDTFLRALGLDPSTEPELSGTGARVAAAFADELCAGYGVDVGRLLRSAALPGHTELVVLRDVAVVTMCPHHLLPSVGTATVAFAPAGTLVGLGALAAMVDALAHRLVLQEQLGETIVSAMVEHLSPRWAACRLVLAHGCLTARGERKHGARVETLAIAGALDGEARASARTALGLGAP